MKAHTHIYTYIYIHIHTYLYLYTYTYTYTYTYIHTHIYIYTYVHIQNHLDCLLTIRLQMAKKIANQTCDLIEVKRYNHKSIHTYIHIYAYTHTYTYIYIYTKSLKSFTCYLSDSKKDCKSNL